MARTVAFLEPAFVIERARVALQLKSHIGAGGHCLIARQPRQQCGIDTEPVTAVSGGALVIFSLVAHLHVDLGLAGSKLDEPLARTVILRSGIAGLGTRIASANQGEQAQCGGQSDLTAAENVSVSQEGCSAGHYFFLLVRMCEKFDSSRF